MTQQRTRAASTIALEAVERFLGETRGGGQAAVGFAAHLGDMTAGRLPLAAQETWRRVAHLLRASADQPIPEKSIFAMRSWPQTRIDELIDIVNELRAALEKTENDRLEDEVRDSIRHYYL